MQFKEIPKKLVVAKRLSQCLNPALPTGVHQRALDVYSHILAVLGVRLSAYWLNSAIPHQHLCEDGGIAERSGSVVVRFISLFWICCNFSKGREGLLHIFTGATLMTKSKQPTLLNLFDTYYLPLQAGLRPVMKAFILALIPGLEEETGEYFEKVKAFWLPSLCTDLRDVGLELVGSPVRNCFSLIFLAEYLVNHANFPKCTRDVTHVLISTVATTQCEWR